MKTNSGFVIAVVIAMTCVSSCLAQDFFTDANARIEQHRKSDIAVSVVDTNGNPVSGATINVDMKRHEFLWGTAVHAYRINSSDATNEIYKSKVLENFNAAVIENALKWPAWEGAWGSNFGWHQAEPALDWIDANGLATRGHYAAWATLSGIDGYGPDNDDTNIIPDTLFPHITDKLQTVGERITEWDVINHPVGWGPTTYEDIFGLSFYSHIVNHTRAIAPAGTTLFINEDDCLTGSPTSDHYAQIIEYLIDNNATPDGIGFQSHFKSSWNRNHPNTHEIIYQQLERFSNLVPNLLITEFDVDVGVFDDNNNLLSYDQAEHAQRVNDYLISAFSHPNLQGVYMWGFWEGAHWLPEAALYNQDWSERPALHAYQNLVFDQWWTNESGTSNSQGQYNLRGFKGDYDVTVEHAGVTYVQTFNTNTGNIVFEVPATNTTEISVPDVINTFRGLAVSGDVSSVTSSDNNYVSYNPGFTLNVNEFPVWIVFGGAMSTADPSTFEVSVESNANTPGISKSIEAFNYLTGQYEFVSQNGESFNSDSVVTVDLSGDVDKYLSGTTGYVSLRCGWKQTGFTILFPWTASIDHVQWVAE